MRNRPVLNAEDDEPAPSVGHAAGRPPNGLCQLAGLSRFDRFSRFAGFARLLVERTLEIVGPRFEFILPNEVVDRLKSPFGEVDWQVQDTPSSHCQNAP